MTIRRIGRSLVVAPGPASGSVSGASGASRASGESPDESLQDPLAELAAEGSTGSGIREIVFEAGDHFLSRGLALDHRFPGVTLRGDGPARLVGGKRLTRFEPVRNPAILGRLDPAVARRVRVCRLADEGIRSWGGLQSRGFARPVHPSHPELFWRSVPLDLAGYPGKNRYLAISGVGQAEPDGWRGTIGNLQHGFFYQDERPRTWAPNPHLWVHGYWAWDWANSVEQVASLDPDRGFVETRPPYGNYGFRIGNRFQFLNVLEELGRGGDYALDVDAGLVYFLEPEDAGQGGDLLLSLLEEPILAVRGAADIRVEGLVFEAARGHGILLADADRALVRDCTVRNVGNHGIQVLGGRGVQVRDNTVHDCGDGGIHVLGGNRATLERADGAIDNNHIHHIATWTRCYQPAILLGGVGLSARHNLIHDCPHTAILFWGNDMAIESNEIYSVVLETGDAGAIYTGRDYTFRGNEVSRNYIHHLGGVGMGTMGIYNDDCVSGTRMRGNVFHEVSRAIFLGGGRDFIVEDNVFVDCRPAVEMDGRGASVHPNWRKMVDGFMRERFYHVSGPDRPDEPGPERPDGSARPDGPSGPPAEASAAESPYVDRWPELAEIHRLYQANRPIPPSARFQGNVFCSDRKIEFTEDAEKGDIRLAHNCHCGRDAFLDPDFGDWTLRPDSLPASLGHVPADLSAMGLVESARSRPTPRVVTHMRQEGQGIRVFLRNRGVEDVAFAFRLLSDEAIPGVTDRDFRAAAAAGQTTEIRVDGPFRAGQVVELRGGLAGVRPCRMTLA